VNLSPLILKNFLNKMVQRSGAKKATAPKKAKKPASKKSKKKVVSDEEIEEE
jgi:hypothetical protein